MITDSRNGYNRPFMCKAFNPFSNPDFFPMAMRCLSSLLIYFVLFLLSGCGGDTVDRSPAIKPRPVTVLPLEERDFSQDSHLTGSVSLYREEKVGFEVTGRLLWVLDEGKEVDGPAFNEAGEQVRRGQIMAKVDDTRYRLQVDALQARLNAAQQDLESVRARLRLARQTLEREKRVFTGGAGRQQAVDDAQSMYAQALAQSAQREALMDEIDEQLERAKEDLVDTDLTAPFSGRITRIHVSQGAVVDAGAPIVTLSLMDPMQVRVVVSADEDRKIQTGDRAMLYPKDPLDPDGEPAQVNALVYEKGAVADLDTRTFRINLMARNERRRVDQFEPAAKGLPVVADFLPVIRRYRGEEGALFVHTDSIYIEDGKTYVLRLPGVSFHPGARRSAVGKHIPDKVPVKLGDEYVTVIRWNFRSLESSGDLREGDFLVIGPKREHLQGLAIGRSQWLLRPGDLVPVRFLLESTPKGFYVPVDAITMVEGKPIVFVVEDQRARMQLVTVHETYRELRRIEGEGLAPGDQIIISGMHYVAEGEPLSIVGYETLAP